MFLTGEKNKPTVLCTVCLFHMIYILLRHAAPACGIASEAFVGLGRPAVRRLTPDESSGWSERRAKLAE